jgi:hypothetical protein
MLCLKYLHNIYPLTIIKWGVNEICAYFREIQLLRRHNAVFTASLLIVL